MPQFPKPDPLEQVVPSNVRLKRRLWARLDEIAKSEDKSRNEVMEFFLTWACEDYDAGKKNSRK